MQQRMGHAEDKQAIDRDEVRRLRDQGMTLREIGDRFGVSRQRIGQLIGPVNPTECRHCGGPLEPDHPNERYCSDRCRNRRNNTAAKTPCVDCGEPCTGVSCLNCTRRRTEAEKWARYGRLEKLWGKGLTLKQIAERLDSTPGAVGVMVVHARANGYDLPLRRVDSRNKITKIEAQNQLVQAVRSGAIRRATRCDECGEKAFTDGHHEDYQRPLYVEWLCRPCHAARHHGTPPEQAA